MLGSVSSCALILAWCCNSVRSAPLVPVLAEKAVSQWKRFGIKWFFIASLSSFGFCF